MAHFAQLNDDNIVTNVVVVNNDDIIDENGNESEEMGISILQSQYPGTKWVQTSYNSKKRGSYAGIGDYYNEEYDVFCMPRPYPSWIFNAEMSRWDPPVQCDTKIEPGVIIEWNENDLKWDVTIVEKPTHWTAEDLEICDEFWNGRYWDLIPKPVTVPPGTV